MPFQCNTRDFPSINNYDDARHHFDATDPWKDDHRIKLIGCQDRKHVEKNMRELDDGSIAFRLYRTDCVIWHPDGQLSIKGWASMSTTGFISCLVPGSVRHGQGRKDWDEPTLTLHYTDLPQWIDDEPWDARNRRYAEYRAQADVIQCSSRVRLHCVGDRWAPVDTSGLDPFSVPTIDRRAARELSRRYNLPTLQRVVTAAVALRAIPRAFTTGEVDYGAIMAALESEQYATAIGFMPRGQVDKKFGYGQIGTPDGIRPGFLTHLRNQIYNEGGAIEWVDKPVLTPSQYTRYIADSKRFD